MTAVNIELDISELSRVIDKALARLNRPKLMFAEMGEELVGNPFRPVCCAESPGRHALVPLQGLVSRHQEENASKFNPLTAFK